MNKVRTLVKYFDFKKIVDFLLHSLIFNSFCIFIIQRKMGRGGEGREVGGGGTAL